MKFRCEKEKIEKALSIAERFTGKNLTLPILSNILLEVVDTTIRIVATNLEYAVEIFISTSGGKNGNVSIPARILYSFLQAISEEKVDIEEKQGSLLLKTNTKEIKINGVPATDFPLIPKIKKQYSFSIPSHILSDSIQKVFPSVSISEFKPELAGIFFQISKTSLRLAATDTFRLAEQTIVLGQKSSDDFSFILPSRAAQEIARVFGEDDRAVSVAIGENQAVFESSGIKIISRLIDGKFPEYGAIVPKSFQTTAHIDRRELVQSVRTSSIFSSKLQDVTLLFGAKQLEITSANTDVGEYKTTLPIALSGKSALRVSFNHRYFLDGLNVMHEETLFVGFNDENSPAMLRNKTDGSFLYVLMPIRVS